MSDKFSDRLFPYQPNEIEIIFNRLPQLLDLYIKQTHLNDPKRTATKDYKKPNIIRQKIDLTIPEKGLGHDYVFKYLEEQFLPYAQHLNSPKYMGHQVSNPLPLAAFSDGLTSFMNQGMAIWEMAPAGTIIEQTVIQWMLSKIGWGQTGNGTLTSGGSAANLTALLAMRNNKYSHLSASEKENSVVLISSQIHYSISRALKILGFGDDQIIPLEVNPEFQIDVSKLDLTISKFKNLGKNIIGIVATSGSTSVGAFDPLSLIAERCRLLNCWFHVDGAHGGSFLISKQFQHLLDGIHLANSMSWDPHKMLHMPLVIGAVLFKDKQILNQTFHQNAPYIFNADDAEEQELNIAEHTIQCSRRLDALKLFICLKAYGEKWFSDTIDYLNSLTTEFHKNLVHRYGEKVMIPAKPNANIICWAYLNHDFKPDNELNRKLKKRINESGEFFITSTVLNGIFYLRITVINPLTETVHLNLLLDRLDSIFKEINQEKK